MWRRGSIKVKKCKFGGCVNYPKSGCGGYCWEHENSDPGYERKQDKKAANEAEKKLRMLSDGNKNKSGYRKPVNNKLIDNEAAKKFEALQKWFPDRRMELTGICQCGCGEPSQKNDDKFYRHCCCHIFPKAKFESVRTHPLNFVERRFWGGCHSVMDDTSMDRWPGMADWDDIKMKFFILAPLLTDKERAFKFYSHLEKLVLEN